MSTPAAFGKAPGFRSGLDRRNARWYLSGLGATVLGDSAMTLAAGIWVKSLTGSSAAAGLVAVSAYAPTLLAPLGGMLADRVRRRLLLVSVNLTMAVIVATLLAVRSASEVWLIFLVMTAYGAANVVIDPAESALFAVMLPTDLRQQINGLRLTLTEGGKLTAPLLGAGLFALLGGGPVAALDAVTFLVAAYTTSRLKVAEPRPADRRADPTPWRTDVMAGYAHVRASAQLRGLMAAGAAAMAISGLTAGAQYGLVDALHQPPAFLGALTAALGAGSIVAGLTSSRMIDRFGEARLAVIGLLDGTAGSLLVATGALPTAVAGFAVLGFALPWTVLAVINLTQRLTPDPLQGRVAAVVTLALFGPLPVTQAIGSATIGPLGYRTIYLLVGGLFLLTAGSQLIPAVAGGRAGKQDTPPIQ